MNSEQFLDRCSMMWPAKPLNADQKVLYLDKLRRFDSQILDRVYEHLAENSKYFPKVADVFESARHCGLLEKPQEHRPHRWQPTECRLCGGSGQLAVFYEQLFDPSHEKRELRLQRIMQYESSPATARQHDWTRYYFRCSCPAGDVPTLPKGIPRWSTEQREYLQLSL